MQLQVAGRLDLAEPLYRSILKEAPAHGAANYCLGMLLVQRRRPGEGLPHLLAAVSARSDVADYWLGYMEALLLLDMTAQAVQTLALARQRGVAGHDLDEFAARLGAAAASPVATVTSAPTAIPAPAATPAPNATPAPAATPANTAPAERKLSPGAKRRQALAISRQEAALLALVEAGRFSEALPLAQDMTERFPSHGRSWKVLAAMQWAVQSPERALPAMHTSVALLPDDAEAHANLGTAYNKLRRLDDAEKWLKSALAIDMSFAPAHSQLGDNYQLQGRYAEAEACFRRAIALFPQDPSAEIDAPHSGLLFMLNHNPAVTADDLFLEHCRVGEYVAGAVRDVRREHHNDPDPTRRLRVGLVSADLRNHAVMHFIEPILRQWASSATLQTVVYYGYHSEDEDTRRLKGHVSEWHATFGMSNRQLAEKIAADGIDLLIDLSGHTAMHRLATFAHKPAPVQVSWLGYPATTGLAAMDYYLTDEHFFPPGEFDRYFTEKLAYLPAVWPFEPLATAPAVNRLPALDAGVLTFGSFNRLGKINQATVALWARVLDALPGSTMVIAGVPLEGQHRRLIEWFADGGVAAERLTFHPWTTQEAQLALHHSVDIALETMPYTGCTTSNHALWMGVPSLTLIGATPASRLCAANLGHLQLQDFVAKSGDEFVAKALQWASNREALAELRAGLRARWQASPARDPRFVADGIERALRHMWRRWCTGLAPERFAIMPDA